MKKQHYKQGTIGQIKINDEELLTSDKKNLAECVTFLKKLYAPKESPPSQITRNFVPRDDETILHEDEKESLAGLITKEECSEALKNMEEEKTPWH